MERAHRAWHKNCFADKRLRAKCLAKILFQGVPRLPGILKKQVSVRRLP